MGTKDGDRHPDTVKAIAHLRRSLAQGKEWPVALLEAMALWSCPEENYRGRQWRYLIGGEAFDWLLLAERLCDEVDGCIPSQEKEALLFHGRFPREVSKEEFRRLLGPQKYSAYLNYWYGITVEQALMLAVEEEVAKEYWSKGWPVPPDVSQEAFKRIYGQPPAPLVKQFRQEKGYPARGALSVVEFKELTYWLFKLRVRRGPGAKVASDTRKGLERLFRLGSPHPFPAAALRLQLE